MLTARLVLQIPSTEPVAVTFRFRLCHPDRVRDGPRVHRPTVCRAVSPIGVVHVTIDGNNGTVVRAEPNHRHRDLEVVCEARAQTWNRVGVICKADALLGWQAALGAQQFTREKRPTPTCDYTKGNTRADVTAPPTRGQDHCGGP